VFGAPGAWAATPVSGGAGAMPAAPTTRFVQLGLTRLFRGEDFDIL